MNYLKHEPRHENKIQGSSDGIFKTSDHASYRLALDVNITSMSALPPLPQLVAVF